jgi:sugar phosphate isomerase/epimerase
MSLPLSRRRFLTLSGAALPLTLAAPALLRSAAAPAPTSPPVPAAKKYPIGIELYAVRGALARDLADTLRQVAKIGYEAVEFYSPYFSWNLPQAKDIRSLLDDLGLRCYSTHNNFTSFTTGFDKAVELNQILGTRYVVLASPPNTARGLEGWKQLCGQLTEATTKLQTHGLTAGYHNHQTEWAVLDGTQRTMDFLAANTPKEFMLQFDVGTCLEAGADPIAWIKANPGRIRSLHLKDWAPGTAAEEKAYRVLFGEGAAPWREICAAAEESGGVEFYLMEQEGSRFSEFETAERCLATWRLLRAART